MIMNSKINPILLRQVLGIVLAIDIAAYVMAIVRPSFNYSAPLTTPLVVVTLSIKKKIRNMHQTLSS